MGEELLVRVSTKDQRVDDRFCKNLNGIPACEGPLQTTSGTAFHPLSVGADRPEEHRHSEDEQDQSERTKKLLAETRPDSSNPICAFSEQRQEKRRQWRDPRELIVYPKVRPRQIKAHHDHPFLSRKRRLWLEPQFRADPGIGWHQVMGRKMPEPQGSDASKMEEKGYKFQYSKCNIKGTLSSRYWHDCFHHFICGLSLLTCFSRYEERCCGLLIPDMCMHFCIFPRNKE